MEALSLDEVNFVQNHQLAVKSNILNGKGYELLEQAYRDLGGEKSFTLLKILKVDFKIGDFVFLYDNSHHFNRYRLKTLKSGLYEVFSFPWYTTYLRLCRVHERECLLSGLQERVWNGPPMAQENFGPSEMPGDLSGNGSAGWKLNAYNDLQYDLISRLHGFKIIRIPAYEHLMIGGSLKRIDHLLLRPNEVTLKAVASWLKRKME